MTHENFNAKIAATLNQMLFFKKKNILEFEGIILYPSEIHLLLMVSRNQPSNATKMAERLVLSAHPFHQPTHSINPRIPSTHTET